MVHASADGIQGVSILLWLAMAQLVVGGIEVWERSWAAVGPGVPPRVLEWKRYSPCRGLTRKQEHDGARLTLRQLLRSG